MRDYKPGCYVALGISSSEMSVEEMVAYLNLTPSERVVMGTPTGTDVLATHPQHVAFFASPLGPSKRMEEHIESVLTIVEPLKPQLDAMQDRCRSVIHCNCVFDDEDGWELSPELLDRLSRLGIALCFSLDPITKKDAV